MDVPIINYTKIVTDAANERKISKMTDRINELHGRIQELESQVKDLTARLDRASL